MRPDREAHLEAYHEVSRLQVEGRFIEALAVANRCLCDNLDDCEAYESVADALISLRRWSQATKALKRGLELNRRSANANYLMGFVHIALAEFDEAIRFLGIANAECPDHPEIERNLGFALCQYALEKEKPSQMIFDRGRNLLIKAHKSAPDDAYIITDIGNCLLRAHDFKGAESAFNRALSIEPDNEMALSALNLINAMKHDTIQKG